jgi:nucleotide-binding universal stress UspA family protein
MFTIKNILLPTDLSTTSLSASNFAIELAIQYKAKIHLLHVLEKTPPILAIRSLDLSQEKILKSFEDEGKKSLESVVKKIKKGMREEIEIAPVLKKGLDYEEIVKYSKEQKIDLIVIATHGRTGLLHTLLGSVAEKVIRYAKCPVLVITPHKPRK